MTEQAELTLGQSITKNAIGLALFAMVTAGTIALVQLNTKDVIEHNIAMAEAKALYEIVPESNVENDLLNDTLALKSDTSKKSLHVSLLGPISEKAKAHFAKKNGKIQTVILPVVAPDGYTQAIQLLVGINMDGTIAGVRIVDHKETPGLGDKVELKKSKWVLSFNGKSLEMPVIEKWTVKKDGGAFDQFTGATITPRAVVNAVKLSLEFFDKYQDELISLYRKQSSSSSKTTDGAQA